MTRKRGIALSVLALVMASAYYFFRYVEYHPIKEEWLCYNPFELSKKGFEMSYEEGVKLRAAGDSISANALFKKALGFRGSHNEQTYERWFTDGNDYWSYDLEKALKYSKCYEALGQIDSAMACLRDGLINVEKYNVPTEENFFRLAKLKYGRDEVLNEIAAGAQRVEPLDCFMCQDSYFLFRGFRVGVDVDEDDTADSLAQQVIRQYQL